MTIKIKPATSRKKIPFSKSTEFYATVTAVPPKVQQQKRAPLDLVAVIDISGSMGSGSTSKLEAAKESLLNLIKFLGKEDHLGVVAFATNVETIFKLTSCANAKYLSEEVQSLRSKDLTNLHGGLTTGLGMLKKDGRSDALQRIALFTDGQANVGLEDPERIIADIGERFPTTIGISTFGYGKDHRAALLSGLLRNGNFYFIDSVDKIGTAFGTEFGSLISTYATDVVMTLTPDKMIREFEVINDVKTEENADGTVTLNLHNLLSEQPYAVIIKATSFASNGRSKSGVATPAFTGILTYKVGSTECEDSFEVLIKRTLAKEADKRDDKDVMQVVAIQEAAKAQKEAVARARKGDLKGAQTVLRTSTTFARSYGAVGMAKIGEAVLSSYTTMDSFQKLGEKQSLSVSNTMSRQTAGTGGANYGGVDVDAQFANSEQKSAAKMFSIKIKKS